MFMVKLLNNENREYFDNFINKNKLSYNLESAIVMPCWDVKELLGIIGCHVHENTAVIDLFYCDNQLEILIIKSLLNVLELRGIYDVFLRVNEYDFGIELFKVGQIIDEKYERFFKGCRFKSITHNNHETSYLSLRGYFDVDACKTDKKQV